ncbi:DNAse I-like superfamily protein [Striga hermonthica]|uniref:DNAse I-like superfamily protein n=1 Tax=Striga hermonthica TaxID=68872 RepID=A0A9N7RLT3_STRHE|nr:DNAse I-like superfamily protein [Striga hermonthica]
MLHFLRKRFRQIWSRLPWFLRRHPRPRLVIRRLRSLKNSKLHSRRKSKANSSQNQNTRRTRPIRLATFNAALFSLAPAVPKPEEPLIYVQAQDKECPKPRNSPSPRRPKGILKQSENQENGPTSAKPNKTKFVSINLPENEISMAQNLVMRSPICISASLFGGQTIFDVLKEVDADVLALQDVKAEEEKDMRPLSDLARALGMNYVFAESWAPEYGNAVLSRWPIKRWKVDKICDDKDFRNVIKATIDVPWTGELNVYCTQLDHLDESWRIKQIQTIIQSNDQPHVLAGGLNSLDASDYSSERWSDIVKYYEEMGKPSPKIEVTSFLKGREYEDAKEFQGECEPVVMIAKGQNVQGTCKYGTRVDYILGSPGLSYNFVPGSYSVFSSKGTSDHHIVKVDIVKESDEDRKSKRTHEKFGQSVARLTTSCAYIDTTKISS